MSATVQMPQRPSSSYREFDDAEHYEIIDGLKVELPPMSAEATAIATGLSTALNVFGVAKDIGRAYTEMLFHLPLPIDRNRRPDVAFVPFSRWPKNRSCPASSAWDVLPDLGVEVISPFDLAEEVLEKVQEYFRAGMRLVWLIYPSTQAVEVFENFKQARILTFDDELDGGIVAPGFRLPLRELFLERKA
jgi:Uma2 family endonuclease